MESRCIAFALVVLLLVPGAGFQLLNGNQMLNAQEPKSSEQEKVADIVLPKLGQKLTDGQVASFAKLALKNINTEYPNKPSNVVWDSDSVREPKEMHPAFYGCFDWHALIGTAAFMGIGC